MIKNLRFLVLGMFLFGMSEAVLIGQKKKDSSKIKGEYKVHVPFLTMSRQFFEELWKKHPAVCTAIVAGAVSASLYPEKFAEMRAGMHEYRHVLYPVSMAALALAYWNREAILSSACNLEDDDEEGSESGHLEGLAKFSQSGVRVYRPGEISTLFSDVAGLETVKEDLTDILIFLRDQPRFKAMGAKVPKGVLLSGAPGNGKTLIARALAGEAGCPFLYVTASEFLEAIVGIGAARVRSLFAIARDLAPCIIFIDEIDSIGRKRGAHSFGADTELTQTLNQLLAEMDGFEQSENPIIVIGATNRADVLDEALLRPGRFDRHIEVHSPYVQDRCKILRVHLKNVKTSKDIDVYKIALGTAGLSGAELAKLVNEAAILALRENAPCVTMAHIDQARDYMWLGRETKGMEITKEEYWTTAIHEAGHALCTVYQKDARPLFKVTITPRGGALGLTFSRDVQERHSYIEKEMRASIVVMLGGSVAEEMMFGIRGAGASSDIDKARTVATDMVMRYGMSAEFKDISFSDFINNQFHLPDQIATKLHQEVAKIINECRIETESILLQHKENLVALAEMLIRDGTVSGKDVYCLCNMPEPETVGSLAA